MRWLDFACDVKRIVEKHSVFRANLNHILQRESGAEVSVQRADCIAASALSFLAGGGATILQKTDSTN
uniref:Uncharacterized protein n=1 Tax=Vespula pensylvanica TaxID=30213 RepID=A0A834KCT1_VESPE|nr:hypothetical protein H0235_014864 [Vespula pensylvanica]